MTSLFDPKGNTFDGPTYRPITSKPTPSMQTTNHHFVIYLSLSISSHSLSLSLSPTIRLPLRLLLQSLSESFVSYSPLQSPKHWTASPPSSSNPPTSPTSSTLSDGHLVISTVSQAPTGVTSTFQHPASVASSLEYPKDADLLTAPPPPKHRSASPSPSSTPLAPPLILCHWASSVASATIDLASPKSGDARSNHSNPCSALILRQASTTTSQGLSDVHYSASRSDLSKVKGHRIRPPLTSWQSVTVGEDGGAREVEVDMAVVLGRSNLIGNV